jgi:hypothetical protein
LIEDKASDPRTENTPDYVAPAITVMSDEDVLRAFQMTAAQIGAAAVWWTASCVC